MAISEVCGLDRFAEYMRCLEDCHTVIGGMACDIVLSDADLNFRATKDIDLSRPLTCIGVLSPHRLAMQSRQAATTRPSP